MKIVENKIIRGIGIVGLSLALGVSLIGCKKNDTKEPVETTAVTDEVKKDVEVVAKVNGVPVYMDEFLVRYAAATNAAILNNGLEALDMPVSSDDTTTLDMQNRKNALMDTEYIELYKQAAAELGVSVDEADIDAAITSVIEELGGEDKYEEKLAEVGFSKEYYRLFVSDNKLMQAFYEAYSASVAPTDEEIEKIYNEHKDEYFTVKASHILVDDEAVAKELLERAKNGEDFATLAKENSKDEFTAENGGDLGVFVNGDMVGEFNAAVAANGVGLVPEVVHTQFGYHIINIVEKTDRELDDTLKESIKTSIVKPMLIERIRQIEESANIEEIIDLNAPIEIPESFKINVEAPVAK